MKKKFSTAWKASKQPRKQRKYAAHAPLHTLKKLVNVNLSKELRKSQGKRSIGLRKGDTVVVKKGKFKGTKGKVLNVKLKTLKVEMENVQVKKADGSKTNVKLKPWNLQIVELDAEARKKKTTAGKTIEKKTPKQEDHEKVKSQDKPAKKEKKKTVKQTKPGVKNNAP